MWLPPRGGPTQVTRLDRLYALGDARTSSTPLFSSLRALLQKAAGRTAPARSAAERTWMYPERMRRPGAGKAHGPPRRQPGGKHRRLPRTHSAFSASKVGDRTSTHTAHTRRARTSCHLQTHKEAFPVADTYPPPPSGIDLHASFFFLNKICSLWFNLVHRLRRNTLTAAAAGGEAKSRLSIHTSKMFKSLNSILFF